jgi:hypothetical protein
MPWWHMGQFVVDDTPAGPDLFGEHPHHQHMQVTKPAANAEGAGRDKIDTLSDQIIVHLRETTGRFDTVNKLADALRAKGVHVTKSDLAPALLRLANRDLIEWPDAPDRKPRPGWLRRRGGLRWFGPRQTTHLSTSPLVQVVPGSSL